MRANRSMKEDTDKFFMCKLRANHKFIVLDDLSRLQIVESRICSMNRSIDTESSLFHEHR